MVTSTVGPGNDWQVVIRPNQSLTWRQTRYVFFGVLVLWGVLGAGFAVLGLWPVLPFAGAEVAVLGICLYLSALAARRQEVVSIRGDTVAVEKLGAGQTQRWEFQRAWARIRLVEAGQSWYPTRLFIRSHGRQVPLGDFLNEDERLNLAGELEQALASTDSR